MRIVGLCLVAVFALTAFAASSASALPEIGRCVSQPGTGKYKDSNCTVKAGKLTSEKSFEWKKAPVKTHFTSAGGAGVLETETGTRVECTAQSAAGEYKVVNGASKEVTNVVATFTGCSLPIIGAKCNTVGHGEGEIVTNPLKGPMGYISGKGTKTPVVGQELTPVTSKGAFATFECSSAAKIVVKEGAKKGGNCIISTLAPANVMSTTASDTYAGAAGKQEPQHFEGSTKICNLESALNGGAAERSTQLLETTITNEEELEIKA
jgi:hypothetical protein